MIEKEKSIIARGRTWEAQDSISHHFHMYLTVFVNAYQQPLERRDNRAQKSGADCIHTKQTMHETEHKVHISNYAQENLKCIRESEKKSI